MIRGSVTTIMMFLGDFSLRFANYGFCKCVFPFRELNNNAYATVKRIQFNSKYVTARVACVTVKSMVKVRCNCNLRVVDEIEVNHRGDSIEWSFDENSA